MTKKKTPNDILTIQEVAEKTGKSPSTIYRWLDEGSVQEVRVGKQRYVNRKSLVAFLGTYAKRMGI